MIYRNYYSTLFPFKWHPGYCLLLVTGLLLSVVSSSLTINPAELSPFIPGKVQPLLLEMAERQPDGVLSIIVQKDTDATAVEQTVANLGGHVTSDLHIINAFAAVLPAPQLRTLASSQGVRWISLDNPVEHTDKKEDKTGNPCPDCIDTSNLKNAYNAAIEADKVWNEQPNYYQGQGIGVAVIDSSIAYLSEFQADKKGSSLRIETTVKINPEAHTFLDQYGHGTHVAGIIGGNGSASDGAYIGVAPQVNLINVKVSDDKGVSTASDLVRALQWINDNKAAYNIRVINISLNSSLSASYHTDPIDAAVEILWFNGVVVVTSAGNHGQGALNPPANDPFVITVGATTDRGTPELGDDQVADFSAFGLTTDGFAKPDLVAPGVNIISDLASKNTVIAREHPDHMVGKFFFRMSGTSVSAPMVSGAVALLLQSNPRLNPDQVKARLKNTAVKSVPRWSGDTRLWSNYDAQKAGAGYLDIYAAIHSSSTETANTGTPASRLLWTGSQPPVWSSVNWSSVNWSSVNWSSVNWSSVNWSSVNWSSDYWER